MSRLARSGGGDARQSLGTYRWPIQTFCNAMTVAVTQVVGAYRLEGTDDQSGATTQVSVVGAAFLDGNGTTGLGLTVVSTPGAAPLMVDARTHEPGSAKARSRSPPAHVTRSASFAFFRTEEVFMRYATVVLSLGLCLPAGAAEAQPRVIDQSAPTDAEGPFTLAIGGVSGQVLYQTVTAGVSGQLMEVRVPLACADGVLRLESGTSTRPAVSPARP